MRHSDGIVLEALVVCMLVLQADTWAQFVQQGNKLVGTGAVGSAAQSVTVAISSDGNTAIVGGPEDNSGAGAVWIFTRNGGVWSQQGAKLVGTGAAGNAMQGTSVSISADGNTAIVGGYNDNDSIGGAWVFTRNGGVWSQQGDKLVGTGAVGGARQGFSVSLSADGNTAIVGGIWDSSGTGAAWVFTRSGDVWSQQGNKLVGTGAPWRSEQGYSASLSADGNTAIVGAPFDGVGAAWVFTRSASVWSQQGNKLVGTGTVIGGGSPRQGYSVSLSADGNTAIVGGYFDDHGVGASWVFIRSEAVWSQQGEKLKGMDTVGIAGQGVSVSLSADGNTALVGGCYDDSGAGAAWVFTRSGGVWSQDGTKLVGTGAVGSAGQGISVSLSADGNTAIVGGVNDSSRAGAAWIFIRKAVGVDGRVAEIPAQFQLEQNHPNPFNPSTTITYELPKSAVVKLAVYDLLGREVSVLVNERKDAGVYEVNFDGSNLASGVYLYRMTAGSYTQTRKLVLIR